MIVKNEEKNLSRCLSSLCDLMDEVIIVDTGSTDRTKEIASQYTDLVYDFEWNQDFAAARNYAFSKASMEYIYTADADEVLDEINRERLRKLKEVLLPEVELVQMKYVTKTGFNTVLNAKKEYRPKLYKRLRTFEWVDPIHETVRLTPTVYDSEIEILHLPEDRHEKRDFSYFQISFDRNGYLSNNMLGMYAQELFLSGNSEDFLEAEKIFDPASRSCQDLLLRRKITCVLARIRRLQKDFSSFLALILSDISTAPTSEICCEIGEYFFLEENYSVALDWFYNAVYETEPILDIHSSGDRPLYRMADCCEYLASESENGIFIHRELREEYKEKAAAYRKAGEEWTLPEEN